MSVFDTAERNATPEARLRTVAVLLVLIVALPVLGYWGYSAYKKRELRGMVAVLLKDTGGQLREALSVEAGPPPADRALAAKRLDEQAAAADSAIQRLKQLAVERDRALTDAADAHLAHIREILRKQAASHRLYQMRAESLGALQDHMRADNRTGRWVRDAVRAKERAEQDFREYRLAVAAYGTLLGSFPTSQKKIAPYVDPAALIDEALVVKAREKALATASEAAAEMDKARQLLTRR